MNADITSDGRVIAALATPRGRGALALLRLSGHGVRDIASVLLSPAPRIPRHATHCVVLGDDDGIIDDVVAVLYHAPHSFTGEDMLEISTHGGAMAPTTVMAAAIRAGARAAEPGEFTRRAVLNGKMDLLQAEAIGDLIEARSTAAHRLALHQLDGGLSRRIGDLRGQLLTVEAQLAYDIDFPDEDDGPIPRDHIVVSATKVITSLNTLLSSAPQGALVHDGALVVLAGAPNVGKSSLFNALLGEARAIVTEVPGTTRDAIEAILDMPQWPLRLIDTAGLRETNDPVERLGIAASSRYLRRADLVLACVDDDDSAVLITELAAHTDAPIVVVHTKCDLVSQSANSDELAVSANTGEGIGRLLLALEERLQDRHGAMPTDVPLLTRARHQHAVRAAVEEVEKFVSVWRDDMLPASVAATHIHEAVTGLGSLIGAVKTDDILDVVFRNFCVGK